MSTEKSKMAFRGTGAALDVSNFVSLALWFGSHTEIPQGPRQTCSLLCSILDPLKLIIYYLLKSEVTEYHEKG